MTSGLTQYDVEELQIYSGGLFSQRDIAKLYKRFTVLDKGNKGYVAGEEFRNIPELSINPLAQRVTRLFDNVNFREFVRLLAAFARNASQHDKIAFIFQVFDVDGDGCVSGEDLEVVVRQLVGGHLSSGEVKALVAKALAESGSPQGLGQAAFQQVLGAMQVDMVVDVPLKY